MYESSIPVPEFGSQHEDLQAVCDLVAEVKNHNTLYTHHGIMAHALGIDIEDYAPGANANDEEVATAWLEDPNRSTLSEQQETDRTLLNIVHGDALVNTGLSISPVRFRSRVETRSFGYEGIGSIYLMPTNGYTFTQVIIRAAEGTAHPDALEAIEAIVREMFTELSELILVGDDDTAIIETVPYASPIATALERMGSKDEALLVKLRDCNKHASTKSVKEWLLADRMGLLEPPDDTRAAGPSFWHRQLPVSDMITMWRIAIRLITGAKTNLLAQTFYTELLGNAWKHLEYSQNDWYKREAGRQGHDKNTGHLFTEIRAVLLKISGKDPRT